MHLQEQEAHPAPLIPTSTTLATSAVYCCSICSSTLLQPCEVLRLIKPASRRNGTVDNGEGKVSDGSIGARVLLILLLIT
jgi:hypothetical protein